MADTKGVLLIISGPSGSGKGTVCKALMAEHPEFTLSVSATTRQPRPGEEDGVSYFFKTVETFEREIGEKKFLEYANVFGNYYGTPKAAAEQAVAEGKVCILEIDVQGALQVMENFEDYVSVFILPPSMEELENRLRGRQTETEEVILRRLAGAKEEIKLIDRYDYLVINDTVDEAVNKIESILTAYKCRTDRR